MIMITDNNDSDEKKKDPTQICCDGVNIAILVWKGKQVCWKKKKNLVSVCFLYGLHKWFWVTGSTFREAVCKI